jgi:3-oxoadipate CoA-transferase alpha subunit
VIDKTCETLAQAVHGIPDGSTILIGGFGEAGNPTELIHALIEQGARELVVINNNSGTGDVGLARLIGLGRARKLICSFPRSSSNHGFANEYRAGRIELEIVPQGTLAERIRAGGAGIPAFYTPTGVGTIIAEGKEEREFGGRTHLLENAIRGDFAFVKAEAADRWGNLRYRMAARNFGPVMATAADVTIAQVRRFVELGDLDPESIITPCIYVDRIVEVKNPIVERHYLAEIAKEAP